MVTLKQIKDYLSINNNTEDDFLKQLYNLSLGHMEGYCKRVFYEVFIPEEHYQGNNRQYLKLNDTPVLEVEQVKINGKIIEPEQYCIKNGMLFYPNIFPAKYGYINNKLSAYNREYNIIVSYRAGYTFPKWTDAVNTGTVPQDLQYVCLELIKKMYINSGVCPQVQTKTVSTGGESVAKQYFKQGEQELFTIDIKSILNRYI